MPTADISSEARAMIRLLQQSGVEMPGSDEIQGYRDSVRAAYEPYVRQALDRFDGEIEDGEIAGVGCKLVTPKGWSKISGACVQYAYGGGYVSGSCHEDLIVAAPLAQMSGARVVMVDYRLSPEHPYPLPQQDMQAVYPALLEQYGASRLALAGESAGGNQALALLQYARDEGLQMPSRAALLSPWCDLGNRGDSHEFNDGRDPTLGQSWVESAARMHAAGHAFDDPGISPLFGDMAGLPPILITSGSRDLLMSQALRLAQRLRDAGVDCDLRVWEGLWHVFEFYPIPEAERSIAEIAAFIRAQR
jgi:epsilon-lactone hydrolase